MTEYRSSECHVSLGQREFLNEIRAGADVHKQKMHNSMFEWRGRKGAGERVVYGMRLQFLLEE